MYCNYIFFYLGNSDLLPVLEAEWKNAKGLSVLVKCVEGKVNQIKYNIFRAKKQGLEVHFFWVQ